MTNSTPVADRVRELLSQVLDLPPNQIGEDFSAESSGNWTSLNHLMLVSQLEGEFGVVFTNQEISALTSYEAIVSTLGRRLASGS